jgi:hypothetical protein
MFKFVDSPYSKVPTYSLPLDGSTALTAGAVLYNDVTSGTGSVLRACTASVGTVQTTLWVATQTVASGATVVKVTKAMDAVMFIADCTNATNANQLLVPQPLTDSLHVANVSNASYSANKLNIFFPIATVGPSTQNQLLGFFISLGNQTA